MKDGAAMFPLRVGVGNDPNSVAAVRRANVGSRYAMPFRVIPERGQISKYGFDSAKSECCDVFDNHISRSNFANDSREVMPQAGPGACNTSPKTGAADVLARKAAADDVNGLDASISKGGSGKFSDICEARDFGPVLTEYRPAIFLTLTKGERA
jgi:hypothetical protein